MTDKSKHMLLFAALALLVVAVSQTIGWWVNSSIPRGASWEITGFIHLTHIRNFGGVFGMAQGMGWLFGLISVALLLAVVAYLALGRQVHRIEYICFGFIVGGGASNIIDRLVYGSVIDYIDVQHIPFWNYIFNTADVMVHVGIWPLLVYSLIEHRRTSESPTGPE